MEREVKKQKEKQARVQWRPDLRFVTDLPQEQSIFNDMQHNHQPNLDRRRFSLENIPGLYDMPYSQLLALANNTVGTSSSVASPSSSLSYQYMMDSWRANNTVGTSSSVASPSSTLNYQYMMDSWRANNTVGTSSSVASPLSTLNYQYLMDSWIPNWRMETTNPWFLNPGSSIGINSGIAAERPMQTPQYVVSTPQKFICDLNLPPEELLSTSLQPTGPEFITLDRPGQRLSETYQEMLTTSLQPTEPKFITLDTPGQRVSETYQEMLSTSLQPTEPEITTSDSPDKTLSETDQESRDPIKKSFLENTGSPAGVKKGKRVRDDEKAQLKTPALKRKKIRPKVVSEGKTKRVSSKSGVRKTSVAVAAAATATKTSEESSYVRPKRSSRRSLRYDFDFIDEDFEYCGIDFSLEGHTNGEEPTDATLRIFGNIPKKRRQRRTNATRRQEIINPSSEQGNDCRSSMLSLVNTGPTTFIESEEDLPSDLQVSQCLRRKRSNRVTRARNFRSLKKHLQNFVPIKFERKVYKHHHRLPQLKAIVPKMQSTVSRKKRSQRDPIASQINARVLSLQWQRLNPKGTSFADMCERSLTIDSITKLFEELDINREGPCLPHNRETALILHKKAYEEQRAIVKYSKKQLPKVQLDPETNRMWKLLMLSSDSDGIDGSDEEKRKWWEEERNVFHGRALSFIARMRTVQGDRTFSPWKGSVVDSVVGVFLTQNVADHSSSSAYMDLAAEFPVDWNFNKGSCPEELGSSVTHETVMNLYLRNAVSTPRIRNPTCVIIEEIDDDDDIEALSSQGSSKTNDSSISSTKQSEIMLLDPFHTVLVNEQVDSQMVKCKDDMPNTDSLNGFSQGMVSSTSTHFELDLNEVPPEVENCDAFINQANEDSQVQHMYNHNQELENTLQAENKDKNTKTEDMKKNKKDRKKPTTSRQVGRPPKDKSKVSTKKKSKEPAKKESKETAKSKLEESFDWDSLRKQAESGGQKRERTERTMDTVDWDALRCTSVNKIAAIIRKRGMNNMLAERIKAFLNRLVLKHGSIDLEWLRDVPPDKAKEYLLSINGLGLKSVECVRLLSLRQIAFPVDTNVGRIAVRLGWVPLQPLPDELQMHLLELYPVLESVQKYLWPRLCKLDQKTLYELHYHMITFGKVFCTKAKPNCYACPMKAECRHYSSACASARLALPEPEESQRTAVMIHEGRNKREPFVVNFQPSLFLSQVPPRSQNCEPIIEEPASPEPQYTEHDIEDYPWDNNNGLISRISTSEDPWENKDIIPTIMLNKEADTSKELVVLSTQASSIPRRKLKITEKLRTEHHVYELPDCHPILKEFEKREAEDIVPYLLAIWTPGETVDSIQPPKQRCVFEGNSTLCHEMKCFECNKIREDESQIVRGTILIPCRTAMRGGFPLNGTYFQTNEVFADHGSSVNPIEVPRQHIWDLPRRITYFGSSVTAICKGLSVDDIQENFQKGYVCVRGFNRENRKPMALVKRLHCAPSNQEPKRQSDQEPKRRRRIRKPSKSKLHLEN